MFQQFIAPFDTYSLSALVFVVEKTTNKSVAITRSAVGGPLNNFITSSVDVETKSNYTYGFGTRSTTVAVESRALEATVGRSTLAQAFTICMLTVNWALTAGSVYITRCDHQEGEGDRRGPFGSCHRYFDHSSYSNPLRQLTSDWYIYR